MEMKLIWDGVQLMVFGMGTVLVFLFVMIFCMNLLKKVLAPFAGMLEAPKAAPKAAKPVAGSDDLQLAAVAVAAVEMARNK